MSKKGFLGLFIKSDENEEVKKEEVKKEEPNKNNPFDTKTASVPMPDISQIVDSKMIIDKKMQDSFEEALESSNMIGNDYFEFRQSIKAMKSMPLDDKNKFLSVYQVLSASDKTFNKEKLSKSIEHYLQMLNNEKDKFQKIKEDNFHQNVVSRQNQYKENEIRIKELAEQIQKVNEEIMKLQANNAILQNEVDEQQNKISIVSRNFENTINYVIKEINDDTDKIKTYIEK